MAVESLFREVQKAAQSEDFDTVGRIVDSAKQAGYDPDAFKQAYKTWERTGQAVEPTPLRQIAQGAQLGFSDELAGFGAAIGAKIAGSDKPFADLYANRRDAERSANKLFQASSPGQAVALQMAGGLTAPPIMKAGAPAVTMGARAANAAKMGAGYGAAAGFGMGEGDAIDQLISTGIGAGAGAVVGGAISPLADAAGAGVRALTSKRPQPAAALPVRGSAPPPAAVPMRGGQEKGRRAIAQAMLQDDISAESLLPKIGAMGKPETLADMVPASGATARLARGARTVAPAAGGRADDMLTQRNLDQAGRVLGDLEESVGVKFSDPVELSQQIVTKARAASKPFYDEVRAIGEVDAQALSPSINTTFFKKAYQHTRNIPALRDQKLNTGPVLDEMYKFLGAERESIRRQGGNARQVEVVSDLMNQIRASLDNASGGKYSQALSAYSGDMAYDTALSLGTAALKKDSRAIARELAELGPDEQNLYRAGALDALRQRIQSKSDNRDLTKEIFGSPEMRQKLSVLIPSAEARKAFEDRMRAEARMVVTGQSIRGGSNTADKAVDALTAGDSAIMGAASSILSGDAAGGAASLLRSGAVGQIGARLQGLNAQKGEGILSSLLETDPAIQSEIIRQIMQIQAQKRAQAGVSQAVAGRAVPATSGLVPAALQ